MAQLIRWTIKDLVQVIEKCVENQFDFICLVEGSRGLGKSTLIFQTATRLNTRGIVKFNPHEDIVYSRDDTIKLLAKYKKHFIFADEVINTMYNRNFFLKDQQVLLKGLNCYRDSCNVFMGAIPSFIDADNQLRRLCKMRITVIRRGIALIHLPSNNIFTPDIWETQENIKREQKFRGNKKSYGKLTTVKGILQFSDLRDSQKIVYEKIKHEKRGKIFEEIVEEVKTPMDQVYDKLFEDVINFHRTKEDIEILARTLNKNYDTIRLALAKRIRVDPNITQPLKHFFDEAKKRKEKLIEEKHKKVYKNRLPVRKKLYRGEGESLPQTENNKLNGKQQVIWEEI